MLSSCQQIFFWLATATNNQTPIEVSPPKTTASDPIPSKNDIIILMYNGNNIYAYSGTNISNGKKYNYNSINSLLKKRKNSLGDHFIVFIKTDANVQYKSTVDMLDQMTINDIKKYSLTELNDNEKSFIKQIK
jgi:biopolymer transport protein ExbD